MADPEPVNILPYADPSTPRRGRGWWAVVGFVMGMLPAITFLWVGVVMFVMGVKAGGWVLLALAAIALFSVILGAILVSFCVRGLRERLYDAND